MTLTDSNSSMKGATYATACDWELECSSAATGFADSYSEKMLFVKFLETITDGKYGGYMRLGEFPPKPPG